MSVARPDVAAPVVATDRPAWRMTTAIEMAVALGLVLTALGTLTSRVDVMLLALPLLASAAIGIDRRPVDGSTSTVRIEVARSSGDSDQNTFAYRVVVVAPMGTELVHLRITPQGSRTYNLILSPTSATVTGSLPILHTGRQVVVDEAYRLVGMDGGWLTPPTPTLSAERVVDPTIAVIASMPLPYRLIGMNGAHGSARAGDGGEFRDLHPYAPGDRLRRIDWKATARRSQGFGDLYVRRTDATSDATIVVVIDSRDDVGEHVERWSATSAGDVGISSMDLAREAAASLATAAIGMGDRVSVIDLAAHDGVVMAGSGKRHLERVLRRIAVSGPSGFRLIRRRAPVVPAGAIVYLLSTFLDDDAQLMAQLWRAAGHRVIAVDVLPTPRLDGSTPHGRIAFRLLMAERRRRIAELLANGVEMLRWQEDEAQPSRAIALRTLARAGRRHR